MSNSQISTFNFKTFPVRTQLVNNEPRFCLADVCAILDIKNPRDTAKKVLDPKGVDTIYILTNGGEQAVLFINEPNLYRIIFKSRKAEAVDFQNWVFEEVLPQIRKTGQYSVQKQLRLPKPEKKYAFELTESELQGLTWAWFAFIRGIYTFRHIYPAFEKLGSNMSGVIYGQGYEYCHTAQEAHKIISRLTKNFKCDPSNNWRVLKHVREFDTAFRKPTFNL